MTPSSTNSILLVADVGGTHLNLALMAASEARFEILRKVQYRTQEEPSLIAPVQRFLAECARDEAGPSPSAACIAGAGPVRGNRIALTHAPWDIDGDGLAAVLGIPVRLVNDFTALTYGALQLDPADEQQLRPLPHGDQSLPVPDPKGVKLVIGAGTGLGVGFAVWSPAGPLVLPSEGGHIGLPLFDEESAALWRYLQAKSPGPLGAETVVSGPGLATLLAFLVSEGRVPSSPIVAAILALPLTEQPRAIARQAETDPACRRALERFVDHYARVCAELAAAFLPTGGLYLAGGIAAKNEAWFLAGQRFMSWFETNHLPHLDALTRATPVFIVRDYAVSLYGAAVAAGLASDGSLLQVTRTVPGRWFGSDQAGFESGKS